MLNYYVTDINGNRWLILVKKQLGFIVMDDKAQRGIGHNMVTKVEKLVDGEYVECEFSA